MTGGFMRSAFAASLIVMASALCGQEFKVGSKIPDFNFQDLDGKTMALSTLRGPVTVITFIATQCPVSNAYNDRMNAVYKDYTAKGVKFVFLNANKTEPPSEVREHAKSVGLVFPVYKDANNVLADRFGATVTPESYVIDGENTIRYHGSIDDSQNEARVRTRGLRAALDAVMAGKPVAATETKAFGCTIKRVRKPT